MVRDVEITADIDELDAREMLREGDDTGQASKMLSRKLPLVQHVYDLEAAAHGAKVDHVAFTT